MNRKDWSHYYPSQGEMAMRLATSPHHTNPRSATLDFWRQTTSVEEYKKVQERRRLQTNRPTSSNEQKEEHLIIAHRMAEMEKRRVGTRFLEREVTQSDLEKPFLLYLFETKRCSIM